jgi:hypothetical protein
MNLSCVSIVGNVTLTILEQSGSGSRYRDILLSAR